jgi:hypothetical protein
MIFLTSLLAKFTGEALKGGAEFAKTISEVPKNVVETEKARLEVVALQRSEQLRDHFVVAATFQDVMEFDPKAGLLRARVEADRRVRTGYAKSADCDRDSLLDARSRPTLNRMKTLFGRCWSCVVERPGRIERSAFWIAMRDCVLEGDGWGPCCGCAGGTA